MIRKYISVVMFVGLFFFGTSVGMALLSGLGSDGTAVKSAKNSLARQIGVLQRSAKQIQLKIQDYSALSEKVSTELSVERKKLEQKPDAVEEKFLNEAIKIDGVTYQYISETVRALRAMLSLAQEHVKLLKDLQSDPSFIALRRPIKASPSFDDLKKISTMLSTYKMRLDEYEKSLAGVQEDESKRQGALDAINKELVENEALQKSFAQNNQLEDLFPGFSRSQKGDLLDKKIRQLTYKKELAAVKVEEGKFSLSLFETKVMIARKQVKLLEEEYAQIKQSIVIDAAHIKEAETELDKKQKSWFLQRDSLNERIRRLLPAVEQTKRSVEELAERLELSASDITAINAWIQEPESLKTIGDWLKTTELGALSAKASGLETQVKLLEAQLDQARIDFHLADLDVHILRAWQNMTQRQFRLNVEEELEQALKKFASERTQLRADLADLSEKRDATINQLYKLNIARDKIKALMSNLKKRHTVLFGARMQDFQNTVKALTRADEEIRKRINFVGKLVEIYANNIAKVRDGIKKVDDVVYELELKSFWMRSEKSIEWNDLKSFIPDVKRFLYDLRAAALNFVSQLSTISVREHVVSYLFNPYLLIMLLLRLFIVLALFFLLRFYLPDLHTYLARTESSYHFLSKLRAFVAAIIDFIDRHLIGIYTWSVCFLLVKFNMIDHFVSICFYLISIPYLLYLAYRFLSCLRDVNRKRGYIFIKQHYKDRFFVVISWLLYASIVTEFFRQAFILGNYYGSRVPEILFAFNVILLQIALISLISKELVLGIFASRATPISRWIEQKIEKYYYLFLIAFIAIVIMINPYVGYGRQVSYILSRLLVTVLILPIFSWLHNRIKRTSSDFFFYYADGSIVKERFSAGKTWYGFFVVATFLFFVLLGLFVVTHIWGYSFSWTDVSHFFSYQLYDSGIVDSATGKHIYVTVFSLFKICLYVLIGALLAYTANRFVLRRIFDPLLIGSGVQNTILTLSRYVIIIVALLIGLQSAGLDSMAMKLVVLVGLVSFAIKEPLADFFAYFVILVQRPIKIGDYIKIEDQDIMGVVRHITPRSTIVRRKNSVTLIVPNSTIITKTVVNYHYARTFGAFSDIEITVPYSVNPEKARQVIFEVLDANNNILKNPLPVIWLDDFVELGFKFTVRGYLSVDKIMDQWDIASQVRFDLVRRLRTEGINIATPTRILRINTEDVLNLQNQKASVSDQPRDKSSEDQAKD